MSSHHPSVMLHTAPCPSLGFWRRHAGAPMLIALLMVFVYPHTPLDGLLASYYFDAQMMRFPLKDQFFASTLMHTGMKRLMSALEVLVMLLLAVSLISPTRRTHARPLAWLTVTLLAGPMVVSYMKHQSIHGCPWDVVEFGGNLPWLGLFDALPAGIKPGHCFPGGHASGGFAAFAFYFVLRDRHPQWAQKSLIIALLLGASMGWAQIARGAHFLSHNVWSALIVWGICLLMYVALPPHRRVMQGASL